MIVGTAGWSIPRAVAAAFPDEGSHLERYARQFTGVEINSSFHRPHRTETYRRWAGAVPPGFRFSVKLPKTITHERRLVGAEGLLDAFAAQVAGLGDALDVALVQLPPSLAFDAAVIAAFVAALAERLPAAIALEPRHASWFEPDADALLDALRVARVRADPVLASGGDRPGGWQGLHYHRLHGSPRIYYSAYDAEAIDSIARAMLAGQPAPRQWCIFDNTASGAATADALALQERVARLP